MVVKSTRSGSIPASVLAETYDPFDQFHTRVQECTERFRSQPCTPQSLNLFENQLAELAEELCRETLERELNRLEPEDKEQMPPKVRYHKGRYRINKKTKVVVATRFGPITLRSFYYLNEEDGEPGLHPLRVRLGIAEGKATPGLLERVARMAVDQTQAEVRAWLLREHGLKWSNTRLRRALSAYRRSIVPYVAQLQKEKLLAALDQAEHSRGRHRPVLAVGRDGIMVPMWRGGYREASTATVSVYDRRRKRLVTIYLGQMPQSKQTTLSQHLTDLITQVLTDYEGPLPRLAYITDNGSAPDEYYRKVLKKMRNPRSPKNKLSWERVLDFYHVCGYIGKMAEALFGPESKEGANWFAKMRRWLRERRQGVSQITRSATQYLGRRKMSKAHEREFWKAYGYLRRHRRLMDYEGYKRRGLPLGSGVTEAGCKTVFTQRFKRSGMRWTIEAGQVILDLRTCMLSGIWEKAFARDLANREMPETEMTRPKESKKGSCLSRRGKKHQMTR